jgi:hypothetical chaperone protein
VRRGGGGAPVDRAVVGRPVYFVDDDAERDAQAEAALRSAAASAGFREIVFQYEPIAAAFDHEQAVTREEKVLVADIGGGTSDFSLVRVGPERKAKVDRKGDILANHGVHIAGTDFDRRIELASILPLFGYGALRAEHRRRAAARGAERGLLRPRDLAPDQHRLQPAARRRAARHALVLRRRGQHRRLMTVVSEHYGHDLVARAEAPRSPSPAAAARPSTSITSRPGWRASSTRPRRRARSTPTSIASSRRRERPSRRPGSADGRRRALPHRRLDRPRHPERAAARGLPGARLVRGDRFASVATGWRCSRSVASPAAPRWRGSPVSRRARPAIAARSRRRCRGSARRRTSAGAQDVDRELVAQAIDLARRQAGVS